jgi:hypothetical protein
LVELRGEIPLSPTAIFSSPLHVHVEDLGHAEHPLGILGKCGLAKRNDAPTMGRREVPHVLRAQREVRFFVAFGLRRSAHEQAGVVPVMTSAFVVRFRFRRLRQRVRAHEGDTKQQENNAVLHRACAPISSIAVS